MNTPRLIAALLCLSLWTTPAEAAVVWFNGFETGTVGHDMAAGGNCAITGTSPRSGAYALDAGGNRSCNSPDGFALTTAYLRFYVFLTVSGSSNTIILRGQNAALSAQIELRVNQSTRLLNYTYNGGSVLATGTIPLAISTWYLVEAKFVNAAGTGGMEVKLDNVVQFSDFTQTTNGNGAIDHFRFAFNYSDTLRFDDILLSDSAYPGPGRSISRQGTSGSPTYTAWTKNSCTSSLIENCWSNIPFTAGTPNASSSTPTDAQTMLVAPFSSTQSGHGTEVLASGDTINACKAAIVAKAATGSQLYLRRRLGGANTDTLLNLSASDAYYQSALFTDTFTNLNAAEIGAVQNSGP